MIRKPTVFVLGAGASRPYGFPLGIDLVDQICSEILGTSDDSGVLVRLQELGHPIKEIRAFGTDLRGTRPYSIDTFLETRQEFLNVGKAMIADVLLRAEGNARPVDWRVDWY